MKTKFSSIASTAVAVALSCIVVCITLWGLLKLPRTGKRGVAIITAIYTLVVGSIQIYQSFKSCSSCLLLLAYDWGIPSLRYVD